MHHASTHILRLGLIEILCPYDFAFGRPPTSKTVSKKPSTGLAPPTCKLASSQHDQEVDVAKHFELRMIPCTQIPSSDFSWE